MNSNPNYLVYGTDYELIQKKIEDIESSLQQTFDEVKIDLEQDSTFTLLQEVETIPFLTDCKVVIVSSCEKLLDDKSFNEENLKLFFSYLRKPVPTTILIMTIGRKIDESTQNYKFIKNSSNYVKVDDFTDNVLTYAEELFTKEFYTIDKDAVDFLIAEIDNPKAMRIEAEKLKSYCYSSKHVTLKDVSLLIPKNLESNIYELINAVLARDKNRAMHTFIDLQMQNTQSTYILSQLLTKFQEMYDVKKLVASGYSQDDIAKLYNVKSGRAYYMMKNASNTNAADIAKNLKILSDLESDSKSGYADIDSGLQLFILR